MARIEFQCSIDKRSRLISYEHHKCAPRDSRCQIESFRVGPEEFPATIYQHLEIDFRSVAIRDFSGRPTLLIRQGEPIVAWAASVNKPSFLWLPPICLSPFGEANAIRRLILQKRELRPFHVQAWVLR